MDQQDIENRFAHHPPSEEKAVKKAVKHAAARAEVKSVAETLNDLLPEGREKSLAFTHLENALFWANASLARNE